MYAVFFMSDTLKLEGIEDQAIITGFPYESAAYEWIAEKLVAAGELLKEGDKYLTDEDASLEDAEDAVMAWQEGCGILEWFHVYKHVELDSLVN